MKTEEERQDDLNNVEISQKQLAEAQAILKHLKEKYDITDNDLDRLKGAAVSEHFWERSVRYWQDQSKKDQGIEDEVH